MDAERGPGGGRGNAVSGTQWGEGRSAAPQNDLVTSHQPRLDGIDAGEGVIRHFVAMPLDQGYSGEAQVTSKEERGGIQPRVDEPKPVRFPDAPPPQEPDPIMAPRRMASSMPAVRLGAAGTMRQRIDPNPYGVDARGPGNAGTLFVHLVNSEEYPPPTPVDARAYIEHGFPWFDLYDEGRGERFRGRDAEGRAIGSNGRSGADERSRHGGRRPRQGRVGVGMIATLGAIGYGLVWGWLAVQLAAGPRTARNWLVVGGATVVAGAAALWLSDPRSVAAFGVAALAAAIAHAAWRGARSRWRSRSRVEQGGRR